MFNKLDYEPIFGTLKSFVNNMKRLSFFQFGIWTSFTVNLWLLDINWFRFVMNLNELLSSTCLLIQVFLQVLSEQINWNYNDFIVDQSTHQEDHKAKKLTQHEFFFSKGKEHYPNT